MEFGQHLSAGGPCCETLELGEPRHSSRARARATRDVSMPWSDSCPIEPDFASVTRCQQRVRARGFGLAAGGETQTDSRSMVSAHGEKHKLPCVARTRVEEREADGIQMTRTGTSRDHRKLKVFSVADVLVLDIYNNTKDFPLRLEPMISVLRTVLAGAPGTRAGPLPYPRCR